VALVEGGHAVGEALSAAPDPQQVKRLKRTKSTANLSVLYARANSEALLAAPYLSARFKAGEPQKFFCHLCHQPRANVVLLAYIAALITANFLLE
jgi:hypothetical protein